MTQDGEKSLPVCFLSPVIAVLPVAGYSIKFEASSKKLCSSRALKIESCLDFKLTKQS